MLASGADEESSPSFVNQVSQALRKSLGRDEEVSFRNNRSPSGGIEISSLPASHQTSAPQSAASRSQPLPTLIPSSPLREASDRSEHDPAAALDTMRRKNGPGLHLEEIHFGSVPSSTSSGGTNSPAARSGVVYEAPITFSPQNKAADRSTAAGIGVAPEEAGVARQNSVFFLKKKHGLAESAGDVPTPHDTEEELDRQASNTMQSVHAHIASVSNSFLLSSLNFFKSILRNRGEDGVVLAHSKKQSFVTTDCIPVVGVLTFVIVFCTVQILTAAGGASLVDLRVLTTTKDSLSKVLGNVTDTMDRNRIDQMMIAAAISIGEAMQSTKLCSQLLAGNWRTSKLHFEDKDAVAGTLYQLNIYHDTVRAKIGRSDGMFYQVGRVDSVDRNEQPRFSLFGTVDVPSGGTGQLAGFEQEFDEKGALRGTPELLATTDSREQEWYRQTVENSQATWVVPHIWTASGQQDQVQIHIDACIPMPPEQMGVQIVNIADDESAVGGVACCSSHLQPLRELLANLFLEDRDVAYIVEMGNDNDGLLIAAANSKGPLPVTSPSLQMSWSTSKIQLLRLSAHGYPSEYDEVISWSSGQILGGRDTWGGIIWGDMVAKLPPGVTKSTGEDLEVTIKTVHLDGTTLGTYGRWTSEKLMGLSWALVHVHIKHVHESTTESNNTLNSLISKATISVSLLICISLVISTVLCIVFARPVLQSLNKLTAKICKLQTLSFDLEDQPSTAYLLTLSEMDTTFVHMQTCLRVLSKFVPQTVSQLLVQTDVVSTMCVGQLCFERRTCTVLSSSACNLSTFDDSELNICQLLQDYLAVYIEVIERCGGVVTDFVGDKITALWFDGTVNSHRMALKAIEDITCAVEDLLQLWQKNGMDVYAAFKPVFGVHMGSVLIGSYGCHSRMKFGPVGDNVEIAERLCGLAKTYGAVALVSDQLRQGLERSLSHQAVGTLSIGMSELQFYEMKIHPNKLVDAALGSTTRIRDRFLQSSSFPIPNLRQPGIDIREGSYGCESSDVAPSSVLRDIDQSACWGLLCKGLKRLVRKEPVALIVFVFFQISLTIFIQWHLLNPIVNESGRAMNSTLHSVSRNLSGEHVAQLAEQSINTFTQHIQDLPVCAEMIASDFRQNKYTIGDRAAIERNLNYHAKLFEVEYAYLGTRNNDYVGAYRANNDTDRNSPPYFAIETTMYNEYPNNLTKHTDKTMLYLEVDGEGHGITDGPVTVYSEAYNPRDRPWFSAPRKTMAPTMVEPFIWIAHSKLGIDFCVPVYEDNGLPKIDLKAVPADWDAQWNESLKVVTCCDNSLAFVSGFLSELDLGPNGVGYIVETGGIADGFLIGAGSTANELAIARTRRVSNLSEIENLAMAEIADRNGDGSYTVVERLAAVTYPDNKLIEISSRMILRRTSGGWGDVGAISFREQLQTTMDGSDQGGTKEILVRTELLGGDDMSYWKVNAEGAWDPEGYRFTGMRWVMVIVIYPSDFVSVRESLQNNEEQILRNQHFRFGFIMAVYFSSLLLCLLYASSVEHNLKGLQSQMNRVRNLDLHDEVIHLSHLSELRKLQVEFDKLRTQLKSLEKYVPNTVIELIRSESSLSRKLAGELIMSPRRCTILCCKIVNFGVLSSSLSVLELLDVLDVYLHHCLQVIESFDGILSDFEMHTMTVFWTEGPRTGVSERRGSHAALACQAAEALLAEVEKLNNTWRTHDLPACCKLSCTIGLKSTVTLIGNYGTQDRIKYGVVGPDVNECEDLVAVAKSVNTKIVVHADTREELLGVYLCPYLTTSKSGILYSPAKQASTFEGTHHNSQVGRSLSASQTTPPRRFGKIQKSSKLHRSMSTFLDGESTDSTHSLQAAQSLARRRSSSMFSSMLRKLSSKTI